MKRIVAPLLTVVLLTSVVPAASAKPTGDWNAVRNLAGQGVAVKTKDGVTSFGILGIADDAGMKVQMAGKEEFAQHETLFRRDEVEKVWRARLRFGGRHTGKGAWIGAGVGAVAGVVRVYSAEDRSDGQLGLAIPAYTIFGAGIGAVIGAFSRKGHKKGKLIYSL
jgi:hypothetical protein